MKRVLAAAMVALLLAGCGGTSSADVQTLASSIRDLDQRGAAFKLSWTEVLTGGDIPKGQYGESVWSARGQVRNDTAVVVLSSRAKANGPFTDRFDIVMDDTNSYVRPHGSTRDWFVSFTYVAEDLIPGVRLNLLHDTALLATSVSRSTSFTNGGVYNRFAIVPAADQLGQLMSFGSSGTITAYLGIRGNQLSRVDGHFVGTDSSNHRHLVVDTVLNFSKVGAVGPVTIPSAAIQVQPADLFSTAATPSTP